jgi:hypothetical protein
MGINFTMKLNSYDKILCGSIVNNQKNHCIKMILNFDWSRSSSTTLTSPSKWLSEYNFLSYRPFLSFQAQVQSTPYVHVYESSNQTHTIGAYWNAFGCNFIFKFEFGDLEWSWSTADDLEMVLWTQRASSGPTHKRSEGRAPVWGSEFT